jgi:uncharacterized alpha-E superfamily protein
MLSRLSGNTFWMARYLERAENTTRLLSAAHGLSLAPEAVIADFHQKPWHVVVAAATDPHRYAATAGPAACDALAAHLFVDRHNPSSVVSSLHAVRENARSIRHLLTGDSWEAINATYLEAHAIDADAFAARGLDHWLGWSRQRCQWIKGALDDQLRDELHRTLQLAQALERGDFTARLLLSGLPPLLVEGTIQPGTAIHRQWEALLAAAGMLDAYYRTVSRALEPAHAIELLVRGPSSMRSIASCALRLEQALSGMSSPTPDGAESLIRQFVVQLALKGPGDLPAAASAAIKVFDATGAALQREQYMPSTR